MARCPLATRTRSAVGSSSQPESQPDSTRRRCSGSSSGVLCDPRSVHSGGVGQHRAASRGLRSWPHRETGQRHGAAPAWGWRPRPRPRHGRGRPPGRARASGPGWSITNAGTPCSVARSSSASSAAGASVMGRSNSTARSRRSRWPGGWSCRRQGRPARRPRRGLAPAAALCHVTVQPNWSVRAPPSATRRISARSAGLPMSGPAGPSGTGGNTLQAISCDRGQTAMLARRTSRPARVPPEANQGRGAEREASPSP